mmetsp:Transcript_46779/g.99990  ORF Transcript_46779/g.99990 Transcript_46779/m.99990 type:complete len:212 (+) Transcript_46779:701-1336(+)
MLELLLLEKVAANILSKCSPRQLLLWTHFPGRFLVFHLRDFHCESDRARAVIAKVQPQLGLAAQSGAGASYDGSLALKHLLRASLNGFASHAIADYELQHRRILGVIDHNEGLSRGIGHLLHYHADRAALSRLCATVALFELPLQDGLILVFGAVIDLGYIDKGDIHGDVAMRVIPISVLLRATQGHLSAGPHILKRLVDRFGDWPKLPRA